MNIKKDYPPRQELTEESLDDNSSLKKMLSLVGENKTVVDFGCATGYLAKLLLDKGCKVTGVEINAEAGKMAEQYCEQVIIADLDFVSLEKILPNQVFDVAVFGDVLEHLRDPWRVLKETRQLLKPEGYVVASIPNIAHGAIRLALLQGRFDYMKLGILDDTHLRFFTRKTVEELFENSGYLVDVIERTKLPVFSDSSLVPAIKQSEFDRHLIQKIEQEEEAKTFQFVLKVFSSSLKGKYTVLQKKYCQLNHQLEHSQSQQYQTQTDLEHSQSQLYQTQLELNYLQVERQKIRTDLKQFQSHLQKTQAELEYYQLQLHQTQAKLARFQALIAAMESSKFWQLRAAWFCFKQAIKITKGDEFYQSYVSSIAKTAGSNLKQPKPLFQFKHKSEKLGIENSNSVLQIRYLLAVLEVKGIRYVLIKLLDKSFFGKALRKPETLPRKLDTNIPYSDDSKYQQWLNKNYPRQADLHKLSKAVEKLCYKPIISIVMPIYNVPERFLREAIESVIQQVYPEWELCIADDCSTEPHVKQILQEYSRREPRIKVNFRDENGHISRASNSALEIAEGEFIALLDHDDLLTPNALYEVALLLNQHPEADMIYSDEDKVDENNILREPFFKTDWCPDSFLSRMYTCHLGVYRRTLVREIGNFRVGYEGSQDYDLVLRITEKTDKIFHIPKVLYHWRIHPQSAASGTAAKPYAYEAGKRALSEAILRRGETGEVLPIPKYPGLYAVRYAIQDYKLVSIIIPTKDLAETLDKCLRSIFQKSTYPNYEVTVIDNGSIKEQTAKCINKWKSKEPNRFSCYRLDIPFNFSRINNYAVEQARGNYLLFLNNDTEITAPDWIDAMVEQAQRPSIGAVGALLLYPDKSIQHAGVVLGIGGVASHSHRHYPSILPGYFGQVVTINNYSAVTGACLMCRREVFDSVNGFAENLAVFYNDIDFCLKLVEKGYKNIYLPHVVLYHYESKSLGKKFTSEKLALFNKETEYMKGKWKFFLENDPCYSPHLTKNSDDYSINLEHVS